MLLNLRILNCGKIGSPISLVAIHYMRNICNNNCGSTTYVFSYNPNTVGDIQSEYGFKAIQKDSQKSNT